MTRGGDGERVREEERERGGMTTASVFS